MIGNIFDSALFEDWLREKKSLAESTIYTYVRSIERFLAINPNLERVEDYNDFLIKVSIKKRCPHYYSAIKAFIDYKIPDAATRKRLLDNLIKPPQRTDIFRERRYLDEEKIFQVINYLDKEKHRVIALIQTLAGVRAGDILRLRSGNIVPEVYKGKPALRLVLLGKGRRRNVIYIHDEIAQTFIMNYVTSNKTGVKDYYFLELGKMRGREGQVEKEDRLMKMNYWWYWADLKQALNTAGIDRKDFASHDFRRCFARRVWEKYKDVHVLQGMLNHADPKVTLRYLEQSGLKNIDYHYEMQNS